VTAPSNAATKSDDVAKSLGSTETATGNASLAVEVLGYGEDEATSADEPEDNASTTDDEETKKKKKAKKKKS